VSAIAGDPALAPRRVGVFGGSFDPPHVGHLIGVLDIIDQLALDRVQVVPAGTQPLKQDIVTSAEHRLAMSRACFKGMANVEVDPIEIERGGLSFMIETVEHYAGRWPDAELFLVLGADAAASLDRWREPERLLHLAQLIVLDRVGSVATPWKAWTGIRVPQRLSTRRLDVSSSEIRARVASGRSIRGFVPESVAEHIAAAGLYLSRTAC
jgi:nicotinate-nucleotide adenylyltransferase